MLWSQQKTDSTAQIEQYDKVIGMVPAPSSQQKTDSTAQIEQYNKVIGMVPAP